MEHFERLCGNVRRTSERFSPYATAIRDVVMSVPFVQINDFFGIGLRHRSITAIAVELSRLRIETRPVVARAPWP